MEAELKALPLIADHKAKLLQARPRIETTWRHEYAPGLHDGLNGERIAATERELTHYNADGTLLRTAQNGGPSVRIVNLEPRLGIPFVDDRMIQFTEKTRPTLATKSADDKLFQTYLEHANLTGYYRREAETMWGLFKSLCNKPLKEATRDDGRLIVKHLTDQGLKRSSIQKKLVWLNSAVNLAIKENKLEFNPFYNIVPKKNQDDKDEEKRQPLGDADIRNAKRNLCQLNKSDQMLFRLLAATGMRLSEAYKVDREMKERGVRYIIVGNKTQQSRRRVPLPTDVLPYLPKTIRGKLFAGAPNGASKRLNKFLNDIGITDPLKVVHSLRHRAQDRLRAAECPVDIRWELLGHEEETVAEGYGIGSPVTSLKKWIDKIGF